MSRQLPIAERDWRNLPADLLKLIAEQFCIVDAIRFAAVCRSWCSAASSPVSLQQKRPYLLLLSEDDNTECVLQDVLSPDRRCQRIDPQPEIFEGEKWFVGSQFGWIAAIDKFSNPSLINPFTRSQIRLPLITTLSESVKPIYDPNNGSLCGYNFLTRNEWDDYTLQEFHYQGISKLVLSSSPATGNFSALGIFHGIKIQLVYLRPGDTRWSLVEDADDIFHDIIFSNGRFLVLSYVGSLYAVDVQAPHVKCNLLVKGCYEPRDCLRYLVESDGTLIQVCRYRLYNDNEIMSKTKRIEVTQLVHEQCTWISVVNVRDQALFLGISYSMSISAATIPGLEDNCIYFTDDDQSYYSLLGREQGELMIPDIGVYNMKDDSINMIHTLEERFDWRPAIWITPSAK